MSSTQSELKIELGKGEHADNAAGCIVRLDASPQRALIEAGQSAHRVYELLLIDRPRDIWDQVWVDVQDVPEFITARFKHHSPGASAWEPGLQPPWTDGKVPFHALDSLFPPLTEDPFPQVTIRLHRRSSSMTRSSAD